MDKKQVMEILKVGNKEQITKALKSYWKNIKTAGGSVQEVFKDVIDKSQ